MSSQVMSAAHVPSQSAQPQLRAWIAPIGRVSYGALFAVSAMYHFTPQAVEFAAGEGVPFPEVTVPATGALAMLGALSVVMGYRTRVGAALLALFLVPVTLFMHRFWVTPDTIAATVQRVLFLKNLALFGAALTLVYHGAGPFSLDAYAARDDEAHA